MEEDMKNADSHISILIHITSQRGENHALSAVPTTAHPGVMS